MNKYWNAVDHGRIPFLNQGKIMPKSEVFDAPAIHTKSSAPDKKEYHFEDRKCRGATLRCTMGTAPKKGNEHNTLERITVEDGGTVMLTDEQYDHLRTRGINKPIVENGPGGQKHLTGRTWLDRRFNVDPV